MTLTIPGPRAAAGLKMFDHNIFQDNLVGVDFCEQMVIKETNPTLPGWAGREDCRATF